MRANTGAAQDWRDAAAYAALLDAERSLFAWEWLRRDPSYRAAAAAALGSELEGRAERPDRFGLIAFEPPHLTVPDARPMWRVDVNPYVLTAEATTCGEPQDRFDLDRMGDLARIAVLGGSEHLLLSDGLRTIRLDAPRATFTSGPVTLRFSLAGLASAQAPLIALHRLIALYRRRRFARALHPPEQRAWRWVLMLRAFDALAAGADQRTIAEELLSRSAGEPRWRSRESSVRSQVQRLVRGARAMARDGYRQLLGS